MYRYALVIAIVFVIAQTALAQTATPTPNNLSPAFVATTAAQMAELQATLSANGIDTQTLDDIRQQQQDAIDYNVLGDLFEIVKYVFDATTISEIFGPFAPIVLLIGASLSVDVVWAAFYPGLRLAVLVMRAILWLVLFVERMLGEWGKLALAILGVVAFILGAIYLAGDRFIDAMLSIRTIIAFGLANVFEFFEPAINAIQNVLGSIGAGIVALYNMIVNLLSQIQTTLWEWIQWINPF